MSRIRLLEYVTLVAVVSLGLVQVCRAQEDRKATGTGFVVDPKGFLLTCNHVVKDATKIVVSLGGKTYEAAVVASDARQDIALLNIKSSVQTSLPLGDSDVVEIGMEVRAFGFPISNLLGSSLKVTRGTISGSTTREEVRVFQIDAPVNPGNSGGPLVNERGEVVGIINAKLAGAAVSNIGFVVPINSAKALLRDKDVEWPAEAAKEKLDGPALVKRVEPAVAFITVTRPAGEEDEEETPGEPGEKPKSEKGPDGPPNCLWLSPEEMNEATSALDSKQKAFEKLDVAALLSAVNEALGSVYLLQGMDLQEQKLQEEAVEYLKKATRLRPNSALAHARLSIAAKAMGNEKSSDTELERAQQLDENASLTRKRNENSLWLPRGEVEGLRLKLEPLTDEDAKPEVMALRAALNRAAAMFAVWRGDYRWVRKVYPLAETEYNKAVSFDPECPEALVGCAYATDKRGDIVKAQELLRKAYNLDAGSDRVRAAIGEFVAVYRKDFLPPRITITAPKPGEKLPPAKVNHVRFEIRDDIGKVYEVEVFCDKKSVVKKFGAGRYDIEWDARGLQYTKPTIRVTAVDSTGNMAEATVTVEVGK